MLPGWALALHTLWALKGEVFTLKTKQTGYNNYRQTSKASTIKGEVSTTGKEVGIEGDGKNLANISMLQQEREGP